MQTFLPYINFGDSAAVLDNRRLGKQRVETLQIMSALLTGSGWVHHPATNMWRGHEGLLYIYQEAVCFEWVRRGYHDTCLGKTADLLYDAIPRPNYAEPPWMGDPAFHRSHQSNLLRKDPEFYGMYFPDVPDDLPYIWPR